MGSKIELTDRLRRLGRWEDASWEKDEKRKKLRAEGKTRREANDLAWEFIDQQYSSMTDHEIEWLATHRCLAMGEMPPDPDEYDERDNPKLSIYWRLMCRFLACKERWGRDDEHGARWVLHDTLLGAPNKAESTRSLKAIVTPLRFLDDLEAKLTRIESNLSNQPEKVLQLYEIQACLRELPKLREQLIGRLDDNESLLTYVANTGPSAKLG